MMVRIDDNAFPPTSPDIRLNLLLSCGAGQEGPAIEQLPRLLSPMGIYSIRVTSGESAAKVICDFPIHIAVVDLTIPLVSDSPGRPGGARILQLLRRLEQPPPTVVVRPRQPSMRESTRELAEALREGAFAVLDRPVNLETMLEVMRRILQRHYADEWPA